MMWTPIVEGGGQLHLLISGKTDLFETEMQVIHVDTFCLLHLNVKQKLSESDFCDVSSSGTCRFL
eukprot:UN23278